MQRKFALSPLAFHNTSEKKHASLPLLLFFLNDGGGGFFVFAEVCINYFLGGEYKVCVLVLVIQSISYGVTHNHAFVSCLQTRREGVVVSFYFCHHVL